MSPTLSLSIIHSTETMQCLPPIRRGSYSNIAFCKNSTIHIDMKEEEN